MKLKPLLPTLREKKRYVAFEIDAPGAVTFGNAAEAIKGASEGFLGELTVGKMGIRFLPDLYKSNKGLVRVNSAYVDHLKASFSLVENISKQPVSVRSLGVSGILNKAATKFLG